MDNRLALRMLDLIEKLNVENLALQAVVRVLHGKSAQIQSQLEQMKADPAARDTVHTQWLPLRQRLESDSNLEEAMQQFLKIVPPVKGVN
jgi:hypothetical protein